MENILIEVVLVMTLSRRGFIKVHLTIVVLSRDSLLPTFYCMKLNVTSLHLIIVLLVRHRVVRIQNNCIY